MDRNGKNVKNCQRKFSEFFRKKLPNFLRNKNEKVKKNV